ncbi:MAG: thiamine diphosphokinase [Tissierellaceae bacterium]|nr:thiamine diphosphokinase [Tissierellaceae bacterium]
MKGLIVSSGKINDYTLLNNLIEENDYIVCADGGLDHLMQIDKIPNVILGDLDSISELGIKYLKENKIKLEKYPSIKDNTDTELAIIYLVNMGIDSITLIGGSGTRLDHTIANIFLLRRFNKDGHLLRIIDDNNIISYVVDRIEIKKRQGWFVSIVPLNFEGINVNLLGFKYKLTNKHIEFGSTLGISNELVQDTGVVEINEGEALVFESID